MKSLVQYILNTVIFWTLHMSGSKNPDLLTQLSHELFVFYSEAPFCWSVAVEFGSCGSGNQFCQERLWLKTQPNLPDHNPSSLLTWVLGLCFPPTEHVPSVGKWCVFWWKRSVQIKAFPLVLCWIGETSLYPAFLGSKAKAYADQLKFILFSPFHTY